MTEKKANPFARKVADLAVGVEVATADDVYDHGFSPDEVVGIEDKYFGLFKRDLALEPTTLDEFKTIIVPWLRIHRTKAFNLFPDKPEKVKRVPKEKVVKVPRVKKEKVVKEKVVRGKPVNIFKVEEETEEDICGLLHFKQVTGKFLTEEEVQRLEAFRSLQV